MASRFSHLVRRRGLLAGCAGLWIGLAALGDAGAAPVIHFVAPGTPAETPSTVSIADFAEADADAVATCDDEACEPQDMRDASLGPIDLAALASYAQAEAEEIEGEPLPDVTRPFRPITDVTVNAALPPGVNPNDPGTEDAGETPIAQPRFDDPRFWGGWAQTNFTWSATKLCHKPLYFEEVNLERYGYTVSPLLQPAISGAHFFLTIPTLPYKMVVQRPRECVYTLGYYRAGSPAPRRWHHMDFVWDPTAVAVEGLWVTALVFIVP